MLVRAVSDTGGAGRAVCSPNSQTISNKVQRAKAHSRHGERDGQRLWVLGTGLKGEEGGREEGSADLFEGV
eukprot:935827-Rhodomonas_salina.2